MLSFCRSRATRPRISRLCLLLGLGLFLCCRCSVIAQEVSPEQPIPPRFRLDFETAARLRPLFLAQSRLITGDDVVSLIVFGDEKRELDRIVNFFAHEQKNIAALVPESYTQPA